MRRRRPEGQKRRGQRAALRRRGTPRKRSVERCEDAEHRASVSAGRCEIEGREAAEAPRTRSEAKSAGRNTAQALAQGGAKKRRINHGSNWLKYMAWAPMASEPDDAAPAYGTGIVLGRAVSTNLTITNAEGELYADDMLAEYVSEFASGELAAEVDNIAVENQAKLYGATYADGEMQMGGQDTGALWRRGRIPGGDGARRAQYRTWFFGQSQGIHSD